MSTYIIENNIDFYKELNSPDFGNLHDNTCLITGEPLTDYFVTLKCEHKFNYKALYTEIYQQKYNFKTYGYNALSKSDKKTFSKSKKDYYIRCPYCRNIQYTLLPFYPELSFKPKYGINTDDKELDPEYIVTISKKPKIIIPETTTQMPVIDENYVCTIDGKVFQYGKCHYNYITPNTICKKAFVTKLKDKDECYCLEHYQELNADLLQSKQEAKAKKALETKTKLDEVNKERISQGLMPLNKISMYDEPGCQAILKSGSNKGTLCNCKITHPTLMFCGKHWPKDNSLA